MYRRSEPTSRSWRSSERRTSSTGCSRRAAATSGRASCSRTRSRRAPRGSSWGSSGRRWRGTGSTRAPWPTTAAGWIRRSCCASSPPWGLQDRFGNRWSVPRLVQAEPDDLDATAARLRERNARIFDQTAPDGQESRRKRQKTVEVVRPEAVPKGDDAAVEREQPVDVPRIRFGRADDFERPWHLALWAPNDPDGPTVILNLDSPILQEAVEHHQEQYPDVYAEEIAKVVRQVFGEVAACKVAHAQKLTRQIPEQELDRDYRNEAALTVALMGLIAEESLLGHRLKQFGRKKGVA